MKNQSIEPAQLLEPCQAPSRTPQERSGDFLTETLYAASSPTVSSLIKHATDLIPMALEKRFRVFKRRDLGTSCRLWKSLHFPNFHDSKYSST